MLPALTPSLPAIRQRIDEENAQEPIAESDIQPTQSPPLDRESVKSAFVHGGSRATVEAALASIVDVDALVYNDDSESLLHVIAREGRDSSNAHDVSLVERIRMLMLAGDPMAPSEQNKTPLHIALEAGNQAAIRAFIRLTIEAETSRHGSDPFGFLQRDALGRTCLQLYCTGPSVETFRAMSDNGVPVLDAYLQCTDCLGRNLLHCAKDEQARSIISRRLAQVDRPLPPSRPAAEDAYGLVAEDYVNANEGSPAHRESASSGVWGSFVGWISAINAQMPGPRAGFKDLALMGEFDTTDAMVILPARRPQPPLHLACARGDSEAVREQLDMDPASINERNHAGFTALHIACAQGSVESVAALLAAGANVQAVAVLQSKDFCEKLGNNHVTPLLVSCLAGHTDVALNLLKRQETTEKGVPLLTRALQLACLHENPRLLEALLDTKVGPTDGRSLAQHLSPMWHVLDVACRAGCIENLRALLRKGADAGRANPADEEGRTILHVAAQSGKTANGWTKPIIEALIKGTVMVDAIDKRGRTALGLACVTLHTEMMRALLAHPHYAEMAGEDEDKVLAARLLELSAGNPTVRVPGTTALHLACLYGDRKTAKALLDRGAEVNARDDNEATPLHHACEGGGPEPIEVVAALINAGTAINATDKKGHTPLHRACCAASQHLSSAGTSQVPLMLTEWGADVDVLWKQDKEGKVCIDELQQLPQLRALVGLLKRKKSERMLEEGRPLEPGSGKQKVE